MYNVQYSIHTFAATVQLTEVCNGVSPMACVSEKSGGGMSWRLTCCGHASHAWLDIAQHQADRASLRQAQVRRRTAHVGGQAMSPL